MKTLFKTTGTYLGFIESGVLFSRDGEYLGWIEGQHAWDAAGKFRGQIWNEKYIIFNRFGVTPVPRPPRASPPAPTLPNPPPNIPAVPLPTGWQDAF